MLYNSHSPHPQIVGATEEVIEEEEIIEDGVAEIINTCGGQQYVQTNAGLVKVEAETDNYDHIIYRLVNKALFMTTNSHLVAGLTKKILSTTKKIPKKCKKRRQWRAPTGTMLLNTMP